MAEFDEKLSSILGNPDAMAQIMQLAQSLSGDGAGAASPSQQAQPPRQSQFQQTQAQQPQQQPPSFFPQQTPPQSTQSTGDLFSSLAGGMDPTLLIKLMPLIQELGGQKDSNARQLLYALRPYLKEERQTKIERALQLARLFHVGKKFLAEWEG